MDIKVVEMETKLAAAGHGVTNPLIILGEDGHKYILKRSINDKGDEFNATLVNELFAYQIGKYLNIPMPEMVVIHVSKELIDMDRKLFFASRLTEGLYVGSELMNNVENNELENMDNLRRMGKPYLKKTWNKFFEGIENKDDIAKILVFDLFISNIDRYANSGNIIIDETKGRRIFAIDHGHAFRGCNWSPLTMNELAKLENESLFVSTILEELAYYFRSPDGPFNKIGIIFDALEKYINLTDIEDHSFFEIVEKIKGISEEMLNEWLNNIPSEWYVNEGEQKKYYKMFLTMSQKAICHILQNLADRNAFSNYRGGKLKWEKEQSLNTAL